MRCTSRRTLGFLLLVLLLGSSQTHAQGIITTVAGSTLLFRGDGGPAVNAILGTLGGVAVDSAGNVYATDSGNCLVARISPSGTLKVVAGNRFLGFSGDGGTATSASFNRPEGIAVDSAGNIYIADTNNQRIRKVSPTGIITTVAGSGVRGFSGDGGPATRASLGDPSGVAVDAAGNIYVADGFNHRIRKISSGIITTVAGNGIYGFSGDGGAATRAMLYWPMGPAVDAAGNLYIADYANNRIRKVSPTGIITTLAGGGAALGDSGPATAAMLNHPAGVAIDAAGNIYIADNGNGRIRKINTAGIITTVASLYMSSETDIAVDAAGNVYALADKKVSKVSPAGTVTTVAGTVVPTFSGDGGAAVAATLQMPWGVGVDATGNIYIADTFNSRIRKVGTAGIITTVATLGTPRRVITDAAGNLYVADSDLHLVYKVSTAGIVTTVAGNGVGGFSGDGGTATAASLYYPNDVALDAAGNMYISDNGNHRIRKVSAAGIMTTLAGNGVPGFAGDGGAASAASLQSPFGVAVDTASSIYIADHHNNRIRKVSTNGIITTVAGNGAKGFSGDGGAATAAALSWPAGVAVDGAGNIYIADIDNHRVRQVNPAGIIATLAGNGVADFSGDDEPATAASLRSPAGVAVDATGNIYIADMGNSRIRKVLTARPAFSASPTTLSFSAAAGSAAAASRQVALTSSMAGPAWTASARTSSGAWLSVSPASGQLPATIAVAVDASSLGAGSYQGSIDISVPGATPSSVSIPVSLTVWAAALPSMAIQPTSLSFQAAVGAAAAAQALRIDNTGGGMLSWSAQVTSGGNWLSVSPSSGSATPASLGVLQVAANPAGLTAGSYTGSIAIASSTTNQTQTVTVALSISGRARLLVSLAGLFFTGVEGGTIVPPQTIGILNTGQGVMNWTLQASTSSGGAWLALSTTSGSSDAASLDYPTADINANVTGLPAGLYHGQVVVNAPGADNSQQILPVDLNVLPRGSNPGVIIRPTGLIFVRQAGTSDPGSQEVNLSTAAPSGFTIRAAASTFDPPLWLEAGRDRDAISPAEPTKLRVRAKLGDLKPNVYFGTISVKSQDLVSGDYDSQELKALFVVTSGGGTAVSSTPGEMTAFEGPTPDNPGECSPTRLVTVCRTLTNNFSVAAAYPSLLEAQVKNDCGQDVDNATVIANFTNGDPLVVMINMHKGIYSGMWRPSGRGAVQVTVLATLVPLPVAAVQVLGRTSDVGAAALNPTPTLASLSPASAAAGAAGLTLTVNGANFIQGSTVRWNSAGRPTNLVSATQLNAAIAASDLAAAGAAQVAVFNPAPGGGTSNALTFTIAAAALFEPTLTRSLAPGFYIVEATLAPGAPAGFWGLEVLTSLGQAAGGFNLGGALHPSSDNKPGFGAFLLMSTQTVTATLNAQVPSGTLLTMRFLDSDRRPIGNPVSGAPPLRLSYSLSPGFYIVEVNNGAASPVTFQLGLAADFFSGGVDTGGYLGADTIGFGAFYVPVAQDVTMKLFGQKTYGAGGAGSMILTLRDSNRQVLQVIGP